MSEEEFIKALVGFLLGIVGTYVGLYWKVKKELAAEYDKDLRADRLKVYLPLWKHTEALAYYSPPGPVIYAVVRELSSELRAWYFGVGGIFLSERARDAYFALQKALVAVRPDEDESDAKEIGGTSLDSLRALASTLRTALTIDVGSRSKPLLVEQGGQ